MLQLSSTVVSFQNRFMFTINIVTQEVIVVEYQLPAFLQNMFADKLEHVWGSESSCLYG